MVAAGKFRHLCPFVPEEDHGTVRIEWTTCGGTIELHSLRAHLDTYADVKIGHEALTQALRDTIGALPGIEDVEITTTWDTATMAVTCSI